MKAELLQASEKQREVIRNLMQFYMYDFSAYVDLDVQDNGLFSAYATLDEFWKDEDKFPYTIISNGNYIGFILVRFIKAGDRNYFSIAEFFVMKKYRRKGIGRSIAIQIFNMHKGSWEIFQKENNKPAQLFWLNIIDTYTNGNFTDRFDNGKRMQDFAN